MKLTREFYNRNSIIVAQELLGKYLHHIVDGEEIIAKIVETEAYMGAIDKAAHSYNNRRTPRTEIMFGPPGYAYVYLIYGMYSCLNFVTNEINNPQAVLIRAVEPISGLDRMAQLRYKRKFEELTKREITNLTNGPGKLCLSMNISSSTNGEDLCGSKLFVTYGPDKLLVPLSDNSVSDKVPVPLSEFEIVITKRINIDYAQEAVHYPWRYYIKGNRYVSAE